MRERELMLLSSYLILRLNKEIRRNVRKRKESSCFDAIIFSTNTEDKIVESIKGELDWDTRIIFEKNPDYIFEKVEFKYFQKHEWSNYYKNYKLKYKEYNDFKKVVIIANSEIQILKEVIGEEFFYNFNFETITVRELLELFKDGLTFKNQELIPLIYYCCNIIKKNSYFNLDTFNDKRLEKEIYSNVIKIFKNDYFSSFLRLNKYLELKGENKLDIYLLKEDKYLNHYLFNKFDTHIEMVLRNVDRITDTRWRIYTKRFKKSLFEKKNIIKVQNSINKFEKRILDFISMQSLSIIIYQENFLLNVSKKVNQNENEKILGIYNYPTLLIDKYDADSYMVSQFLKSYVYEKPEHNTFIVQLIGTIMKKDKDSFNSDEKSILKKFMNYDICKNMLKVSILDDCKSLKFENDNFVLKMLYDRKKSDLINTNFELFITNKNAFIQKIIFNYTSYVVNDKNSKRSTKNINEKVWTIEGLWKLIQKKVLNKNMNIILITVPFVDDFKPSFFVDNDNFKLFKKNIEHIELKALELENKLPSYLELVNKIKYIRSI